MRTWLSSALIVLAVGVLVLACHGGALLRGEQYGYRDAAHYYYPLHQRVQQEWAAGRWPLWDPSENAGMPLLGNPTAAVLYPGKLIFAVVPYPLAARLYVVAHSLLAFATMLIVLRSWGTRGVGSALGGLAYAFGVPVLFQYGNVIYLVGAAWAPLGLMLADRWIRLHDRRAILGLAVVLAIETLGGDLETAYLTGFFSAAYAAFTSMRSRSEIAGETRSGPWWILPLVFAIAVAWSVASLWVAARSRDWRPPTTPLGVVPPLPWMRWVSPAVALGWVIAGLGVLWRWRLERRAGRRPYLGRTLAGLAVSALLAASLSAAQLLPVLEFAGQSTRVAGDGAHEIYSFSLDPTRLIEFVWPNVSGTIFDGNHSWLDAANLSGKPSKAWIPSLYMGGLTLVLALSALRFRGLPAWRVWITSVGLFSLVASFGEFASPIWLARHSSPLALTIGGHDPGDLAAIRPDGRLRDGDGGLYWTLATFLPGFKSFRYPSKFLTFAAIALATLAGQGWDALASGDAQARRRSIALSASLLGLTVIALMALWIGGKGYLTGLAELPRDRYGPLDVEGAFRDIRNGLTHGAIVLAGTLGMVVCRLGPWRLAGVLAIVVMAADLGLANAGLVLTVPQHLFDEPTEVIEIIERSERAHPADGPFRVHRMPNWEPLGWSRNLSRQRTSEFLTWERGTLQPKYGIPLGLQYTLTDPAVELRDYQAFFMGYLGEVSPRTARRLGVPLDQKVVIYPRIAFDLWNTRYFVLPYFPNKWTDKDRGFASFLDQTEQVYPAPDAFLGEGGRRKLHEWIDTRDFQVRRNLAFHPRAWVAHRGVEFRAASKRDEDQALPLEIDDILFLADNPLNDPTRVSRDPTALVWLDRGRRDALKPFLDGRPASKVEMVHVVKYESDRVELQAKLERPGLVVLADVYYPGWTLTIDGRPAPIERANRLMRAAAVEAGEHTLVYSYRPLSFRVGLIIMCSTLAILAGWAIASWARAKTGRRGRLEVD